VSPSRNLFVTGFPSAIGSALVERLARRHGERATITCLVEPAQRGAAEEQAAHCAERCDLPEGILRLVDGEIVRYDLGSGPQERREHETVEIFHVADEPRTGVPAEQLERVHVRGTRNLLDMAQRCPRLRRFHHLSSCAVSGRYDGLYSEDDFEVGQSFASAYEETRFQAEVEVRQRMRAGLEATIYRAALVVGDSADGSAPSEGRLDPLLRAVLRRRPPRLLLRGDPAGHRLNLVPRDFVAGAIDHLAASPSSSGRCYQLCDPSAPSVADFLALLQRILGRRVPRLRLPARLGARALERLQRLPRVSALPPELHAELSRPTRYSSRYALRDLATAHIACPALAAYLPRVLAYLAAHPERVVEIVPQPRGARAPAQSPSSAPRARMNSAR
jgi:nucleoside-diphosphate-sugar epimerase